MRHPDIDNTSHHPLLSPPLEVQGIDWHKVPLEVDQLFRGKYQYDQNGIANLVFLTVYDVGKRLVALKISEILLLDSGLG